MDDFSNDASAAGGDTGSAYAAECEYGAGPELSGSYASGSYAPPSEPDIEPPNSWSPEMRAAHWNTMSPDLKRFVAQREADAHRKITESGTRLKGYEPLDQLFDHWRQQDPHFASMPPHEFIHNLMAGHHALNTQPREALQWLAQQHQVDFTDLLPAPLRSQLAEATHNAKELQTARAEIAQLRAQQEKAEEEGRRRYADARRAAATNVRSAPFATANPKTMQDDLQAIAARHYTR